MKLHHRVIEDLIVSSGDSADLGGRSTTVTKSGWLDHKQGPGPKDLAQDDLQEFTQELACAQELLYASDTYALLVILQALDAAGKDGTIKHVMSGVNPQGCDVAAFKRPSAQELEHDFLWRCEKALPARGRIGIFNRSYYEEVLVTRVHPDLIADEHLASDTATGKKLWRERYEDINAFERHLHRNGTRIVKIFLHISKDEQKKRLLERLDNPAKQWKFSAADLGERAYFEDYMHAYEAAITATSTRHAPWYVIPADHKYAARALVSGILTHTIATLNLSLPDVGDDGREALQAAKQTLLAEPAPRPDRDGTLV
ncbi:MAG: polyphosphate kinase 2 family protein [Actinomycetota bacterium]|nr:polyphosphate kinase 2 family protein [Actinomycetota bacterium]